MSAVLTMDSKSVTDKIKHDAQRIIDREDDTQKLYKFGQAIRDLRCDGLKTLDMQKAYGAAMSELLSLSARMQSFDSEIHY